MSNSSEIDFLCHAEVAQKVPLDPKVFCGLPWHDTRSPLLTKKSMGHCFFHFSITVKPLPIVTWVGGY